MIITPVEKRVYVVDDDDAVRDAFCFLLDSYGIRPAAFASAAAFIAEAEISPCVCLTLDQNVPGMSGIVLLEYLRALGLGTPAILITARPGAVLRRRAKEARATAVLEKPVDGHHLLDTIYLAFGRCDAPDLVVWACGGAERQMTPLAKQQGARESRRTTKTLNS